MKQKLQEIYLFSCFPNSLNIVKMTKSLCELGGKLSLFTHCSSEYNRNTIVHELGLSWHMLCYFLTGCLKQNIYIAAQSRIWSIWRSSWKKNGSVILLQRRRFLQHRIRSGGEAAWANRHYHHGSVVVLALCFTCTSSHPSVKRHWGHRDVPRLCLSQNHRKVEVGRGLQRPSGPAPAQPRPSCPGPCPDGCWVSPERKTGQPVWCLVTLTVKKCFLEFRKFSSFGCR